MLTLELIFKNIKLLAIVALVVLVVWLYKDYQFQKTENQRQSENLTQIRKADSLRYSAQILNSSEIKEYLEYQNKELKKQLLKSNISENRIKEIISTTYKFKDTLIKKYAAGLFVDSSKCLIIKGFIDSSGVTITKREFKNKMDAVAFWERRQWNFLGIKTRFLGKKQMTAKVFDDCGNSTVVKIEKAAN